MEKTHPLVTEAALPAIAAVCGGSLAAADYCGTCPKCRREIDFLVERMRRLTGYQRAEPRGACGMRYHHADCDCEGVGGDR